MKKLVLVSLLLLLCVPAFAFGDPCSGIGGAVLNSCIDFPADNDTIYERENPMGIGMDIILHKSDAWYASQVTAETRFDLENDEQSVFFVCTMDLDKVRRAVIGK